MYYDLNIFIMCLIEKPKVDVYYNWYTLLIKFENLITCLYFIVLNYY